MNYKQKLKRAAKMWAENCTSAQITPMLGLSDSGMKQLITRNRDMFQFKDSHNTVPWTKAEDKELKSFICLDISRRNIIRRAIESEKLDRSPSAISNRITYLNCLNRKARNTPKPINAGCHMPGCSEPSIGKFCEEHARAGFSQWRLCRG